MAFWDPITNWLRQSSVDNDIAANIPILGSYYNAFSPPPPKPQQTVMPPGPQNPATGGGTSKNINLPQPQRDAAMQQALIARLLQQQTQPTVPQQQTNANPMMDQLMKQLMDNLNPQPVALPKPPQLTYDQLYDKYYDIAENQYMPQISALESKIAEREARYQQSAADVKALYENAGAAFSGGGNGANFDQMQSDEAARLANYQDYTNNVYTDSANRMDTEFDQLGISDVGQYSSPKQAEDLAYLQTLNQNSSDAFQRYLSSMEAASGSYDQGMASSYSLAGAEQGEDLLYDHNYQLDALNDQQAALGADRDTALNAMIQQALMGQETSLYNWQLQTAQNKQASQDAIFSRLLSLAGLQQQLDQQATANAPAAPNPMDALNQQFKQLQIQQLQQKLQGGGQSQGGDYTKGILGATQYLGESSPNASNLTAMLQQLLQQQPFRENRFESGSGDILKLTPEQAAQYAMQMAQQQKLSPQDTSALVNAIYAYFGKLQ